MTFKSVAAATCVAAIAFGAGSSAFAQAAPAAPAINHGPPIAGVCYVSPEAAVGASTVGKYVETRLNQLAAQANAELNGETTSFQNDAKAFEAQRGTLDQNTLEQRGAALQVRQNALQRKVQLRQRELQATEQKAFARVGQEMEPLVRQAYQAKGCSILLQSQAIVYGNPAMDLTPGVIQALNGKLTQFPFDRERLDQAAAPAGAAPPIAQTPSTPRPATKK